MKVAILTDGIWPFVIGGMQKHSYYLCKYLARNKVSIDLYYTSKGGPSPELTKYFSDEELFYIESILIEYPPSDKFPGHYLRTSYAYSARIYEKLKSNLPVDLIYAKGLSGWKLLKQKKAGVQLPPVCINVHGYEYYQRAASFKTRIEQIMLRPAFRFVNEQADYIYSYGANISSIVQKHIRGSKQKIIEVPTGIEKKYINNDQLLVHTPREFVFIGRYERRKGIEELFGALEGLAKDGEFKFHFISNIPLGKRKISSQFIYHGQLSSIDEIMAILQGADVLVCPSYAEGMPNVVLEGMAAGCAVIATNVGAVPVMVDNETGWLIEPGSIYAIYQAMKEVLNISADELLLKKNAAIKKVSTSFLWETIVKKMIVSFQFIIDNRKNISG